MKQSLRFLICFFMTILFLSPSFASVVGQISRFQVTNTTAAHNRVVGQISNFCTGTLIGPDLVITAGHCVFTPDTQVWEKDLTFSPARNGSLNPYGTVEVTKVYVHPQWMNGVDSADIAILVLKDKIGSKLGWLKTDFSLNRFTAHDSAIGGWKVGGAITGYPGDKTDGTMWLVACDFYIANQMPLVPQYKCDTYGGMSGSALVQADADGSAVIFGLHTNGHGTFNSGITLTNSVKTFIDQVKSLHPVLTPLFQ